MSDDPSYGLGTPVIPETAAPVAATAAPTSPRLQQYGAAMPSSAAQYNGFIAGIFSGLAKLSVGHPFDTIKVRLQTTPRERFAGPLSCVAQTWKHEGLRGFYKGATPPLVGWVCMDSVMLGSLTLYKRLLQEHVFAPAAARHAGAESAPPLPVAGHALAGTMAGWTVSFLAAPVEHVKARLQVQYAATKAQRLYSGPVRPPFYIIPPASAAAHRRALELTRRACRSTASPRSCASMACAASSAAWPPRCTSAPSSPCGGAATTRSRAPSAPARPSRSRRSTSGPAACRPSCSGSAPTRPTWSSNAS